MKEVNEMPRSGQFVAVWVFEGWIWSNTYRWRNGELFRYDESQDDFTEDEMIFDPKASVIRYFIP